MASDEGSGGFRQLHDTLLDRLGTDITSGTLPAGTRLITEEMSGQLGVSRSVIREVVRVLESLGLLAVRRRVGITVLPEESWNPFDANVIRWQLAGPKRFEKLAALSELRSAIEPMAARLASIRATPKQCGALTAAVIGMSETARSADTEAYLGHDSDFHRTTLEASGNLLLCGLAGIVVEVLEGRTRHSLMPHVANPEAVRLHGVVAMSIQARDPAAAEAAMRAIVEESAEAVEELRES